MSEIEDRNLNVLSLIQNDAAVHNKLVSEIEALTNRNLVCYIANLGHPAGSMVPDDDKFLETILRSVSLDKYDRKLDFMISSYGGRAEVAEKLCKTLKSYSANLRVIVPKSAMSAATLIALGGDSLLLGETSELGPVDPQMILLDRNTVVPANDIITARDRLLRELEEIKDPRSPKIAGLVQEINRIDPLLVEVSIKARKFARELCKTLLRQGLLKSEDPRTIEEKAERFIIHGDQLTHGMGIRYGQLKTWEFPNIELAPKEEALWGRIWELYMRCEVYVINFGFAKYFLNRQNAVQIKVQSMPV